MEIRRSNTTPIHPQSRDEKDPEEKDSVSRKTPRGMGNIQDSQERTPSNADSFPQAEQDWVQRNVNGIAGADWLNPMFSSPDESTENEKKPRSRKKSEP